jgi:hypothetical protein
MTYRLQTFHDPHLGRLAACRLTPPAILINTAACPETLRTYFAGGTGPISRQKNRVLATLEKNHWPWEKIREHTNSPQATRRFLILHEISHLNHQDHTSYKTASEDEKLAMETRACLEALQQLEKEQKPRGRKTTHTIQSNPTPNEKQSIG